MPESRSYRGIVLLAGNYGDRQAAMCTMLRSTGYEVLEAADGAAALELAGHYPGFIDLLITRIRMHGITGPELDLELKRHRAEMQVLFISDGGGSLLSEADAFVATGCLESAESFLVKPFTEGVLLDKIGDLLRHARREFLPKAPEPNQAKWNDAGTLAP